jgi:hypothetical protein
MPLTGAFQDLALKIHNQNIALWTTPGAMARDIRNRSVCGFLTLTCPNGTAISALSRILFAVTDHQLEFSIVVIPRRTAFLYSDFKTLKAPCVELRLALTLYPGWSPFHSLENLLSRYREICDAHAGCIEDRVGHCCRYGRDRMFGCRLSVKGSRSMRGPWN